MTRADTAWSHPDLDQDLWPVSDNFLKKSFLTACNNANIFRTKQTESLLVIDRDGDHPSSE
jgi:hypothetical protein